MALEDYARMIGKFDPIAIDQQIAETQAMQQKNRLADFAFAENERNLARENELRRVTRESLDQTTGKIDADKYRRGLAAAGDFSGLQTFEKSQLERAKAQRDAEKETLASAIEKQKIISQYAGAAKDQASWVQGLSELERMGVDVSQVPRAFSPQTADVFRARSMTGAQQLEQVWKQKGYDLDVEKFGEAKRSNRVTEGISRGNLGVAQAGLGLRKEELALKREELKGGGKAPVGFRWKSDGTQEAIPGGPADKVASATEGERKAATLLQRLEGSQKQLEQAIKDDPSAAKPGLIGSGLRSIGANAAANKVDSAEQQRVRAAQLDLLDAALTLGTGAAYTREQLEGYRESYFPQIGDEAATVKDKKARLVNVIDAAKIAAGRAAKSRSPASSNIDDLLKKYGD